MVYTTDKHEVLDAICFRLLGSVEHVAQVLTDNKHLANYSAVLPEGIKIELPDLIDQPTEKKVTALWD